MDFSLAGNWVFLVLAVVITAAAMYTVSTRNVVHAALALVTTMATAAAIVIMLGGEFVGWVIVLVYIGAVVVLFLFGIMITRAQVGKATALDHEGNVRVMAAVVAGLMFAAITYGIVELFGDAQLPEEGVVRTVDIADSMFGRFVIPFEAVSFVLLAALIGGIVLARRDEER
ncbi:MAG: NADH-quinone oxidoreductase subunit J [Acidimicrobiia bacterium]|nr:NADH-quinone oxidoreductase subunit J [Acidimicrobiia bacterium]MBT8250159.1 NADH-quinone oxidoreductase subunit J [Acidimicrobiia bacterium]NNC43732.1 NADH-quinone oxidoreductase subunit J [Acidimicrobiia bacterium]NND14193.1 NADH-quinone oxidoreductase subunit J [Acidimicrobiia bacterium]NNL28322.1 NADH-quinone oxidoreductase subunit J [Acidimicrobiia bacterium]